MRTVRGPSHLSTEPRGPPQNLAPLPRSGRRPPTSTPAQEAQRARPSRSQDGHGRCRHPPGTRHPSCGAPKMLDWLRTAPSAERDSAPPRTSTVTPAVLDRGERDALGPPREALPRMHLGPVVEAHVQRRVEHDDLPVQDKQLEAPGRLHPPSAASARLSPVGARGTSGAAGRPPAPPPLPCGPPARRTRTAGRTPPRRP